MKTLKIYLTHKELRKRIGFTILIIFLFLFGKKILIPGVDAQVVAKTFPQNQMMNIASALTGGSLTSLSIFALGLGPMMASMIVWRGISSMKLFGVQKLNSQTSDILRKLMTFIVGLIQGMGIAINLVLDNGISLFGSKGWIAILSVAFLLAVGGFLIYWFATMNMEKGIGGSIILIFISMLMSWPQVFNDLFLTDLKNDPSLTNIILAGTVILALILFIGFFVQFYQAEVRLPFVHIMSDDENSKSYFPLRLMAGGGMSFMYAMSFMTIPQYIIPIIRYVFPNATTVPYVLSQISISNTYGIVLYIAIVFLLSFIFAFINVNPEDIAENYQKSGDYFVGVKPGLPTQKFLVKHLIRLATIGAIFFSILSGLPMLLGVFNPTLREFGVIPGQLMFVVILSLTLTDQIKGGSEKYMYPDLLKI